MLPSKESLGFGLDFFYYSFPFPKLKRMSILEQTGSNHAVIPAMMAF